MEYLIAAIVGAVVGGALVGLLVWLRRRAAVNVAQQLLDQSRAERAGEVEAIVTQLQAAFGKLSSEALTSTSEQFLRLAETRFAAQAQAGEGALEAKKKLIDETVRQVATRLAEVSSTVQTLEKDRRQSYGTLMQQLEQVGKVTGSLQETTGQLRAALANPQRRGQWGERMAADVLRLAGFLEGVNYSRQSTTQAGDRPDFTFPLPPDRRINMDVKFPLPNYLRYLDASDEATQAQSRTAFLRDVRARIKEVTTRAYIDPENGTVDYVLVFIPNEQVYGFIHEHDPALLDDALRQKVVLCSPLTLYAMLAVIRQTAESYHLQQTSREILAVLGAFARQWEKYSELVDRMGKSLEQTVAHYDALVTTRTRQLQRQLDKIETLRTQQNVALPDAGDDE
jgi:DNA recombination protein RmuC